MFNFFTPHKRLAIVDLETTGLNFNRDQITEVGVIIINNGVVEQKFHSLVNPQCPLPAFISQLTGITAADLKDAPVFSKISAELFELLQGSLFIAHNAKFDYSFLRQSFAAENLNFQLDQLCTVQFARALFPHYHKHSLESWIPRLGIAPERRHRAIDDAQVVLDLLQYIENNVHPETLQSTWASFSRKATHPPLLNPETMANLPESPGVYIFEDQQGNPLYIGKSINIRHRVSSHFYQVQREPKELTIFNQTAAIKFHETHTELGALLLESSLVKQMYPTYNRQLRRIKQFVTAREHINADGYASLTLETLDEDSINNTDNIIGLYRSISQAQDHIRSLCKSNHLCLKILGLEKTGRSCFGYHIGNCPGTCLYEESTENHNERFHLAFSSQKVAPWPWPKETDVILEAQNPINGFQEYFLIRNWCLVGHGKRTNDIINLTSIPMHFDYDQYKIISQAINQGKVLLWSTDDIPYQISMANYDSSSSDKATGSSV